MPDDLPDLTAEKNKMSDEFRQVYEAGLERIRQRNEWLDRLAVNPMSATGDDVTALVDRIRRIEKDFADIYLGAYCTCFAYGRLVRDRTKSEEQP